MNSSWAYIVNAWEEVISKRGPHAVSPGTTWCKHLLIIINLTPLQPPSPLSNTNGVFIDHNYYTRFANEGIPEVQLETKSSNLYSAQSSVIPIE